MMAVLCVKWLGSGGAHSKQMVVSNGRGSASASLARDTRRTWMPWAVCFTMEASETEGVNRYVMVEDIHDDRIETI